ncbi:hypothetical protein LguiA_012480 [Lonicera macranthoides]
MACFRFASCFSQASDPDMLTDFIVPPNTTSVDSNLFTFTALRQTLANDAPPTFKVKKASRAEFPALDGQSVSLAVLQFPVGVVGGGWRPEPTAHPSLWGGAFVCGGR